MNGKLVSEGRVIYLAFAVGTPYEERTPYAEADNVERVKVFLDRAAREQDMRRYTNSARIYAQVERMPGFRWLNI